MRTLEELLLPSFPSTKQELELMASAPVCSSPLSTSYLRGHRSADATLPCFLFSSVKCGNSLAFVSYSTRRDASGFSTGEDKRKLLVEKYGLDPDDSNLHPAERTRRKEAVEGKGKRLATSSRSTHKLLQVLGGKAHRKKLLSPKGMDVRPMMGVVRGAAFGMLQVLGGCPTYLRPGRWLDLYSGTGSVGIEALSRGCSEVHFVEMDPWVVSEVLRPNLEWTGFLDVSVIHPLRVENFLEHAATSSDKIGTFDYISVTPPYDVVNYSILMEQLSESPVVGEECFVLVEYPLKTSMAESCGHLVKVADRRFGRTNLLLYGPTWALKK
ncbi:hypothetical protein HPP92_023566 [Vanilla planifolia]|uniref:rRNA methyltransferase YlbH n=1 Tax=Vanilla planifolia TaxID=51239 RepID=A0A835UCZ0_VANPL|nr:hypothetical protein HPP92_023566 [Vanilla planifolia]